MVKIANKKKYTGCVDFIFVFMYNRKNEVFARKEGAKCLEPTSQKSCTEKKSTVLEKEWPTEMVVGCWLAEDAKGENACRTNG